jgi:DNA polymerase III subunit epsilon
VKFTITQDAQGKRHKGMPVIVTVTGHARDKHYPLPCKCPVTYEVAEESVASLVERGMILATQAEKFKDREVALPCVCGCLGHVEKELDTKTETALRELVNKYGGNERGLFEVDVRALLATQVAPLAPKAFIPKLERPIVFLDIESTGVDVVLDRIIDLAVVVLNPDGTRRSFTKRFNPGMPIPPEATAVHGITDEDVKDCPLFDADWARKIHAGLKERDFGGYNVRRMDLPMVDEHLRRHSMKLDMTGVRVFDAAGIFFAKNPRKLADCVKRYTGKDLEGAHGALADTEGSLDAFLYQLGEHPELREMSLDELSEYCLNNEGRKPADLAGKMYYDAEGVMRFSFGKEKDKSISEASGFAYWVLRCDNLPFPASTCEVLRAELERLGL